jgi:hypothetical protein
MRTIYGISALVLGACSSVASAADGDWALHGFGDVVLKNDYVTPRGLVVTTAGETVQVLGGLVLVAPSGVAFHAGTWTDLNPDFKSYNGGANVTALNEFDFFAGIDKDLAKNLNVGVEYVQFVSGQPSKAFRTERNIEFSLKYRDGKPDLPYSINPYAKLFWAVGGKSSTVVMGKAGGTFDVELGAIPTWKGKRFTLAAPTWITAGPKGFWGAKSNGLYPIAKPDGNFGVFSTGLKLSTPLSFIKGAAGASIYASAQYYYLINDNLQAAKQLLSGGVPNFATGKIVGGPDNRSHLVFGTGISFGF